MKYLYAHPGRVVNNHYQPIVDNHYQPVVTARILQSTAAQLALRYHGKGRPCSKTFKLETGPKLSDNSTCNVNV
jgi:hypothetical protein